MRKQAEQIIVYLIFLNLLLCPFYTKVAAENPFTPRAYAIRYWNSKLYKVPHSHFLLNKTSPLTASELAMFAKLAATRSLSIHLEPFCKLGNLLCFLDPTPVLKSHNPDAKFSSYTLDNFTNYATDAGAGLNSFKNYSSLYEIDRAVDTFGRYSSNATAHSDEFILYGSPDITEVDQTFKAYADGATDGSGKFSTYAAHVAKPALEFTSYSDEATRRTHSFDSYSEDNNSGDQVFNNYGDKGNSTANSFSSYGKDSNIVGSSFSVYSENGNSANDTFTSYALGGNLPENNFNSYAENGHVGVETFSVYRDTATVGDDSFQSYAKNSDAQKVKFNNYGNIDSAGSDNFTGYGNVRSSSEVHFKSYNEHWSPSFNQYAEHGATFADYKNSSKSVVTAPKSKAVNRWVEPGKFFRESQLKEGNVMAMPDIKDKMPPRSFLPRAILSKIPFSSSNISQMREIFHALDNSSMEGIIKAALGECERVPSPGETKKCVGSIEDMIDFAVSVLGRVVEPRTTKNINGSNRDVLIGKVKGIDGGKVTKSVSCHQTLYPYLLYYCHSVPQVRVYEAEILDPKIKVKINYGVAICHLDTSVWSPNHGAFLALGPGPGKIEVCHWIFENDLTWTIAN